MPEKQPPQTMSDLLTEMVDDLNQSELFAIEEAKYDVSELIQKLMETQGISRSDLARSINVSTAYITKILRGDANFTIASLVRIARVLNCTLDLNNIFVPVTKSQAVDGSRKVMSGARRKRNGAAKPAGIKASSR